MAADLNIKRNGGYVVRAVLSGILLLLAAAGLIFLLTRLIPGRILLWIAGGALLALLLLIAGVWFFCPFDPERALREQGDGVLDELDRKLLRMALSEHVDQQELDAFLADWDIEAAPIKSVLLVAYLMKTRPELHFPAAITPRLTGVLSFCRYQNLKREAHFCKLGTALRERSIPFLILKGGAMKVYRPDFPRWMSDIDVLVPAADYDRATRTALDLGYGDPMPTDHSMDLRLPGSDEGLLDIHKHLEMFTGKEEALNDGLFARAMDRRLFSIQGLLPCPEDMVFIALVNLYKNLAKNQTQESSLTTFFDLKYLISLKEDFNTEIVLEDARVSGGAFEVLFASKLAESVVPGLFPAGWMGKMEIPGKAFKKHFIDYLFKRDVLARSRDAFAGTKVGAAAQKDWSLPVFMWVALVAAVKKISGWAPLQYAIWRLRRSFR